jgi:hypothetical protein
MPRLVDCPNLMFRQGGLRNRGREQAELRRFCMERYAPKKKLADMPEALKLIDAKGRSDYMSEPRMKPFIEWLYTKGCSEEFVRTALFDAQFLLKKKALPKAR